MSASEVLQQQGLPVDVESPVQGNVGGAGRPRSINLSKLSRNLGISFNPSQQKLPYSRMSDDMNPHMINNLGERRPISLGDDEDSYNQVGLVQVANANYRRELNKYNTQFESAGIEEGRVQFQRRNDTLEEYLITQSGRDMLATEEGRYNEGVEVPNESAPTNTYTTSRGRVIRLN